MKITDLKNPWRDVWVQASFRGVPFYVENSGRQGGRRVALHEYPKRDVPYAEDMGRTANHFVVQGYIIGPNPVIGQNYLTVKDRLIDALEQAGPGTLILPLAYKLIDMKVMVASYSVTENRERGGMCTLEMAFVEYGDPSYRPTTSAPAQIDQSAGNVETTVTPDPAPADPTPHEVAPYMPPYADIFAPTP